MYSVLLSACCTARDFPWDPMGISERAQERLLGRRRFERRCGSARIISLPHADMLPSATKLLSCLGFYIRHGADAMLPSLVLSEGVNVF